MDMVVVSGSPGALSDIAARGFRRVGLSFLSDMGYTGRDQLPDWYLADYLQGTQLH